MDDATGETAVPTGARRPRHGEAFWREMVAAWTASGLGARRFCRERGLAVTCVTSSLASPSMRNTNAAVVAAGYVSGTTRQLCPKTSPPLNPPDVALRALVRKLWPHRPLRSDRLSF